MEASDYSLGGLPHQHLAGGLSVGRALAAARFTLDGAPRRDRGGGVRRVPEHARSIDQ
jgi:hypothetical protein